jgi:hypothetical protein
MDFQQLQCELLLDRWRNERQLGQPRGGPLIASAMWLVCASATSRWLRESGRLASPLSFRRVITCISRRCRAELKF